MGGGRGGGGDLSVSFDLLSLVSVGAGSSGLGPLGQCTTTRSKRLLALEELDGLMVTMPLQILPGLRHTCQDPTGGPGEHSKVNTQGASRIPSRAKGEARHTCARRDL